MFDREVYLNTVTDLFASRGLLGFGQIALVLAGGLGALAVVLVVGVWRFGGTGALAVFGGACVKRERAVM